MPRKRQHIADKLYGSDCPKDVFLECQPDIAKNTSWKTIKKNVKLAISSFIDPCIDKNIFEQICNYALKKEEDLTDCECDLLEALRETVAYFTAFLMFKMPGWGSDQGLIEPNGQGKTRPQSEKQQTRALYALCDCAYNLLEELIWELILPNIDKFPSKTQSKVFQKFCTRLIQSPEAFSNYQMLPNMGRLRHWLALMPFMNEASDDLKSCLKCDNFFCDLPNIIKQCKTEKEAELAKLVLRYVANKTMLYAAQRTTLIWTADGYKMLDRRPGAKGNTKGYNLCNREQFEKKDKEYLAAIVACIEANASEECFPQWLECNKPETEDCEDENEGCSECGGNCGGDCEHGNCGSKRCPEQCEPYEPKCLPTGNCTAIIGI